MRDSLWLIVHESNDGSLSVQAFKNDPQESFKNLKGVVGDKPSRATLVAFDFKVRQVQAMSKDLPEARRSPQDAPDGWKLGEGPVWFDKDKNEA